MANPLIKNEQLVAIPATWKMENGKWSDYIIVTMALCRHNWHQATCHSYWPAL